MASRKNGPVCIYEPQLVEEQIDTDLKVSLLNLLIFETIYHSKSLRLAQTLILYPTSRSTVNVTSMASLGLYFFPGALLLHVLPI
jgi:hypothetical protein